MMNMKQISMTISMFVLMIHQLLLAQLQMTKSVAPVLDIDDEKTGYIGQIGERNVLVDLKPHLQIRNIDQISNNLNSNMAFFF